ncbi:mucin-3A-like [Dreissena polymorpha]|uniref:mucin-3A-like n=1 Tax=Dreissena polymorpha TaxID=45954 RepID=UPI00226525B8|nr:mucin-3A-like [Dreissena polymorpha]
MLNYLQNLTVFNVSDVPYSIDKASVNAFIGIYCQPGFSGTDGLCVECPAGTYEVNAACRSCDVGTYQPSKGQTKCEPCPIGYTTATFMSTSVDDCHVISLLIPTAATTDGKVTSVPTTQSSITTKTTNKVVTSVPTTQSSVTTTSAKTTNKEVTSMPTTQSSVTTTSATITKKEVTSMPTTQSSVTTTSGKITNTVTTTAYATTDGEVTQGLTTRTPENTKVDVNEDSEQTSSKSKSTILIISSVMGILAVVLVGIVIYVLRHKCARRNLETSHARGQYYPNGIYSGVTSTQQPRDQPYTTYVTRAEPLAENPYIVYNPSENESVYHELYDERIEY